MPRSLAITSAILFSTPSRFSFENGRLLGSPQILSSLASAGSAASAGLASAGCTASAGLTSADLASAGLASAGLASLGVWPAWAHDASAANTSQRPRIAGLVIDRLGGSFQLEDVDHATLGRLLVEAVLVGKADRAQRCVRIV